MRILHVLNSLDRGGIENMLMNVYRRVNRSQLQFDFLVHTDHIGVYEEEIELLGGRVYHLPFEAPTDQNDQGDQMEQYPEEGLYEKILNEKVTNEIAQDEIVLNEKDLIEKGLVISEDPTLATNSNTQDGLRFWTNLKSLKGLKGLKVLANLKPLAILRSLINPRLLASLSPLGNLHSPTSRNLAGLDSQAGLKPQVNLNPSVNLNPRSILHGHRNYHAKLREFFNTFPLFYYPVIHAHVDRMSGIVLAAAEDAGIPVRIAHSHAKRTTGNNLNRFSKYLCGWFIHRYATHYAACSKEGGRWLFGWGSRKVQVIPDALNVRDFVFRDHNRHHLRRQFEWEDSYVVGSIGRLEAIKNPKFLLRVFARLLAKRPDALLVFLGCGSQLEDVQALAAELRILPSVRFLGDRNDIPQLINALDILAVPSLAEGLGTAVIEAQTNGLPCLVSTGVPPSADMGAGLVQFLPLLEEAWCEHLCHPPERKPTSWRHVVTNGYDAFDVVDRITEFYTKAVKYGL